MCAHWIDLWSFFQQEISFRKIADPISKPKSERASYSEGGNRDLKEANAHKSECCTQK